MKGDIVRVKRKRLGILDNLEHRNKHMTLVDEIIARTKSYYHYGIQISENEIVHFVGPSYFKRKESKIEIISIDSFLRNGTLEIVKDYKPYFSREKIVERALSQVGTKFGIYSIPDNNCEHFATWCATGIKQSQQSKLLSRSKYLLKLPLKPLDKIEEKIIMRF